jgi:hypothetical protein
MFNYINFYSSILLIFTSTSLLEGKILLVLHDLGTGWFWRGGMKTRGGGAFTLQLLMSYIYGAPILDVSRSHTTTHHSR